MTSTTVDFDDVSFALSRRTELDKWPNHRTGSRSIVTVVATGEVFVNLAQKKMKVFTVNVLMMGVGRRVSTEELEVLSIDIQVYWSGLQLA
jgi:pyruvate/2-oxoglutarate dehydrogenase complex dihydrolipoamide dehydrogenase (E3) component